MSDALHQQIMNVQADHKTLEGLASPLERAVYKLGHRDARHAAAELVAAATEAKDKEIKELREALLEAAEWIGRNSESGAEPVCLEIARAALKERQ